MTVVTDLREYGYSYIPCDYELLQNAISAQQILVEAEWFSSTKAPFNQRSDGIVRTTNPHTDRCLHAITRLYKGLQTELCLLTEQLCRHHKFKDARVASVTRSFTGTGNETSDLYLAADRFGGQKSLLRLYLGGEGQIHLLEEEGGGRMTITPPRGSALVVFGSSAPAFVGVSHLKVARVQTLLDGRGSFLYVQPATEEVAPRQNNVLPLSTRRRILYQQQ